MSTRPGRIAHNLTASIAAVAMAGMLAAGTPAGVSAAYRPAIPAFPNCAVYVTNTGSSSMSVIDGLTHTVSASVSFAVGSQPYGVAVSPAGTFVYVATRVDDRLSVVDPMTTTVATSVSTGSAPTGVALLPGSTRLYVANNFASSVSVFDANTATAIGSSITVGSGPYGVAPTPDGQRVYVAAANADSLSVIDPTTDTVVDTVPVGVTPLGLVVSPSGDRVFVANYFSGTVSIVDSDPVSPTYNTVVGTVTVGSQPHSVAISPDGRRLYVTDSGAGTMWVIDSDVASVQYGQVIAAVNVGTQPYGVAVSPAGDRVYVADYGSNSVSVVDTALLSVTTTIPVGTGPQSVAFGPCTVPPTPALPPPPPPTVAAVERVAGADRFATAVAVSERFRSTSTSTVYLASGRSFADALVAGAHAARADAMLLFTEPDGMPATVLLEIERHEPAEVVIVGGVDAVSAAVEEAIVSTGAQVRRVAGADRYATAVESSRLSHPIGASTVYLVSGTDSGDASVAGAYAALDDAPVLLVTADRIPMATAGELARLQPGRIVLVGGVSSIGASIEAAASAYAPSIVRMSGVDRHATSVALSQARFAPGVPVAFLVAGDRFADAFAATVPAARLGGPVLLTSTTCVPAEVLAELTRLAPRRIIAVGGTAALGGGIETLARC